VNASLRRESRKSTETNKGEKKGQSPLILEERGEVTQQSKPTIIEDQLPNPTQGLVEGRKEKGTWSFFSYSPWTRSEEKRKDLDLYFGERGAWEERRGEWGTVAITLRGA